MIILRISWWLTLNGVPSYSMSIHDVCDLPFMISHIWNYTAPFTNLQVLMPLLHVQPSFRYFLFMLEKLERLQYLTFPINNIQYQPNFLINLYQWMSESNGDVPLGFSSLVPSEVSYYFWITIEAVKLISFKTPFWMEICLSHVKFHAISWLTCWQPTSGR